MDVDESTDLNLEKRLIGEDKLSPLPLNLSTTFPITSNFFERGAASARLCICEGRSETATAKIQCCQTCGYTSCEICGGPPCHNYQVCVDPRVNPSKFEAEIKCILPMRLSIQGLAEDLLDKLALQAESANIDVDQSDWKIIKQAIISSVPNVEFHFTSLKRQAVWVNVFDAPCARLEMQLNLLQPEWQMTLKLDKSLPIKSPEIVFLSTPIAKLRIPCDASNLLAGQWHFQLPVKAP
ncbi:hypothetical protein PPACK8108_LOCUS3840 [Phakopsora pachyrhizi]|uniref:Uncharacterized protein n=1 Tax=Phakopsora pachyrhizi TaxID=170000 RepID=A0AAV0APH3_PHAPC|nr:hypothetical protein PPACK8108_LOCUS3840 [Phakopsora pachyrhizi]